MPLAAPRSLSSTFAHSHEVESEDSGPAAHAQTHANAPANSPAATPKALSLVLPMLPRPRRPEPSLALGFFRRRRRAFTNAHGGKKFEEVVGRNQNVKPKQRGNMKQEQTNNETKTAGQGAGEYDIPIYRVVLVKEGVAIGRKRPSLKNPEEAAAMLSAYLDGADREQIVVILLDARFQPIGINTVSIGTLNSAVFHPREVLKPAILANAHSIVIGHNHLSGDPRPSREDEVMARQLFVAAEMLGIPLLDSIIVGEGKKYFSFDEAGRLPEGTKEKLASLFLEQ
jgi:DNA repair protein RadC